MDYGKGERKGDRCFKKTYLCDLKDEVINGRNVSLVDLEDGWKIVYR